MAALTSKPYQITFHCLYPVEMDPDFALALSFQRIQATEPWETITSSGQDSDFFKVWYENLGYLNYSCWRYPLEGDQFNHLLDESSSGVSQSIIPGFGFDKNQSGFGLFFDETQRIFYIHFVLALSSDHPFQASQAESFRHLNARVRNFLVEDDIYQSGSSRWAEAIKKQCLSVLDREISRFAKGESQLSMQKSMGYLVSFFPGFGDFLVSEPEGFPDFLRDNHGLDKTEQQIAKMDQFSLHGLHRYSFVGWQVSTFWGHPSSECVTLLSLFIYAQNLYYILQRPVRHQIDRLYEQIFYQDDIQLDKQLGRSERLSLLLHKLKHSGHSFVNVLKPYQQDVHNEIREYWDFDDDFENFSRDLERCRDSLEQRVEIKKTQTDRRQNNLLFVIAILQLTALVGVVNDYLDLGSRFYHLALGIFTVLSITTVVTLVVGYIDSLKVFLLRRRNQKQRKNTP